MTVFPPYRCPVCDISMSHISGLDTYMGSDGEWVVQIRVVHSTSNRQDYWYNKTKNQSYVTVPLTQEGYQKALDWCYQLHAQRDELTLNLAKEILDDLPVR